MTAKSPESGRGPQARTLFTPQTRALFRTLLLERAARDPKISGVAITGSAAEDREDCWSDIDIAFGVSGNLSVVIEEWTAHLYEQHSAVHHHDLRFGTWIYRVFLMPDTLQVDLAFAPEADFRPLASTFRLVHGKAAAAVATALPQASSMIGMAWLYALHARTSIARGKRWQAEYMISAARDIALQMACLRYELQGIHGREFDRLPPDLREQFSDALVRSLDSAELIRAFRMLINLLISEFEQADPARAATLHQPLQLLLNLPAQCSG